MAKKLLVWRGWTVDFLGQEFRKMSPKYGPMYIPFRSQDGDALLTELLESGKLTDELHAELEAYFWR